MDASFHIRPFAFDRIFSVGGAETAPPPEDLRLQILALEADLARMRQDQEATVALARAEAFEAGLAHARGERETALLSALDALHGSIETIDGALDTMHTQLTHDAAEAALAAAELLAGRAIAEDPTGAIDAAIGRVLKQVARGQEVQIRVHPDLVEDVERLIAARQGRDRRRLNLHACADESLAPGDALIEWDQGGLGVDAAARAAAVRAELETLLPS